MQKSENCKEDHSSEWTEKYAQKVFDRADIVRDVRLARYQELGFAGWASSTSMKQVRIPALLLLKLVGFGHGKMSV
jgi:hypothetical protein